MKGNQLYNENYVSAKNTGEGLKLLDPFTAGRYNEVAAPRTFDWYYNVQKESLFQDREQCKDYIANACGIPKANPNTPQTAKYSRKGVYVPTRDFRNVSNQQEICFDMRQTANCNSYMPTTQAIAVTDANGQVVHIPANDQYAIVKNPAICKSYKTTCDAMPQSERAICAQQAAMRGCGAYFHSNYGKAEGQGKTQAGAKESFVSSPVMRIHINY